MPKGTVQLGDANYRAERRPGDGCLDATKYPGGGNQASDRHPDSPSRQWEAKRFLDEHLVAGPARPTEHLQISISLRTRAVRPSFLRPSIYCPVPELRPTSCSPAT